MERRETKLVSFQLLTKHVFVFCSEARQGNGNDSNKQVCLWPQALFLLSDLLLFCRSFLKLPEEEGEVDVD